MLYMNDYDLAYAARRFGRGWSSNTPNRAALVAHVDALRRWADDNSDGWAYWPKPARAARRAMELIQSTTNAANYAQEREDITDREFREALRPIKAFYKRHG
jgi:hypothetical protein